MATGTMAFSRLLVVLGPTRNRQVGSFSLGPHTSSLILPGQCGQQHCRGRRALKFDGLRIGGRRCHGLLTDQHGEIRTRQAVENRAVARWPWFAPAWRLRPMWSGADFGPPPPLAPAFVSAASAWLRPIGRPGARPGRLTPPRPSSVEPSAADCRHPRSRRAGPASVSGPDTHSAARLQSSSSVRRSASPVSGPLG
jgi:hypothetical protein